MATTQTWTEYNGTSGATVVANRTDANWKNIDDSTTTLYSASPITAGNNSFGKYQALVFSGTANALSALSYTINTATGTGWTVKAAIVSTATTPSTGSIGSTTMPISGTSLAGTFGTSSTGQSAAGSTAVSSISGTPSMYATCLATQLQTTGSAGPGDLSGGPFTITATWTES